MVKADWVKREVEKGYNEADVTATLQVFEQKKSMLPPNKRDIFAWDAKELEEFFKNTKSNREKRNEDRGKYVKLYEDNRFLFVRVDDEVSAEYWGVGTKWCITSEGTSYYSNYRDNGTVFYFLIDKQAETQEKWSRVAICIQNKSVTYYAADDSSHSFDAMPEHIRDILSLDVKKDTEGLNVSALHQSVLDAMEAA